MRYECDSTVLRKEMIGWMTAVVDANRAVSDITHVGVYTNGIVSKVWLIRIA